MIIIIVLAPPAAQQVYITIKDKWISARALRVDINFMMSLIVVGRAQRPRFISPCGRWLERKALEKKLCVRPQAPSKSWTSLSTAF